MNLNTKIIDNYLKEKSLENVKDHWIFYSVSPGNYLFEEPLLSEYESIENLYKAIIEAFKDFKPLNLKLWESIFGQYMGIPEDLNVYLVVGCPNPYDAMMRKDEKGNLSMIFDLSRLSKYSEEPSKILEILLKMITHELAHVYIHKDNNFNMDNLSTSEKIKYIMFDEGFAHLLSYKKDVLLIDWKVENLMDKKKKAYSTLEYEMKNYSKENKKDILERSNTGSYWEKFGAISGFFTIVDYFLQNDKDYKSVRALYNKGYEYMWEYWEGLNKNGG